MMYVTNRQLAATLLCGHGFPPWKIEMMYDSDCVLHVNGYGYLSDCPDTSIALAGLLLTTEILQDGI